MMSAVRVGATVVLACILGLPASALVDRGGPKDPRWIEPSLVEGMSEPLNTESASPSSAGARRFLLRHGGRWEFLVDPRTGLATLVQGEGVPVLPGPGNHLGAQNAPKLAEADLETVRSLTDAFVQENRDLIGPPVGRLVLDPDASGPLDGGRLFNVNYRWLLGDVPVEGAGVFVRINSGNVVQFGAALVGSTDLDPTPFLGREETVRRLLTYSGDAESARIQGEPQLLVQTEAGGPSGLAYRLVWVVRYTIFGRTETWEGRVDAHTGEIVAFRDANVYGRVVGGIYPRTVSDPEIEVPFPLDRVDYGASLSSSTSGAFSYAGGIVSSGLNGTYFNTDCQFCANPSQPIVFTQLGIGQLDFGTGGLDEAGNGASTRADRNAFFHLNQARRLGLKWLPTNTWFASLVGVNVNIQDTCNAFWDGSTVNFFRSGGGCNNTGEISDVMQHEWGHGLDQHTRLGDGATGEATADINALHLSHDAHVGPYFFAGGGSVRDLDKSRRGTLTRTNVGTFCPAGSGPLGREVHCEGEIYGQTQWDLVTALMAKHGHFTGWRTSERIYYTSLQNAGSYLPTGSFPIYNAYLAADDDDGNLANGTPNGAEIYQAFNTHGIAGSAAVSTPGCARPAQPVTTATPVCDRVSLSWTATPGADHYDLFRSEVRMDTAYFRLATLPAGQTTYDDLDVAPATDYWYVVMALNAAGCESTVENPAGARLTAQPILSVTAAVADDTPRGNRSGFPDPGEEVDLHLTLANVGEVQANGISGTILGVTPGVTVLNATDGWPSLAPGATGANQGILRFVTDPAQVYCGQRIRLKLAPAEGSGCPAAASYFDVLLGKPGSPAMCDPTPACYVAPTFDGLDAASAGPSCAETQLSWQAAASHCTNATITYDVYRDVDPDFVPGPQNRVATGLSGTTFHDALLAPGTTYSYLVRANDSRSGAESNQVRRSVTAPSSPDTAPPIFAGLSSASSGAGCGETTLSWAPAGEVCGTPVSYEIYRSTDPFFNPSPSDLIATTFSLSFTDVAPVPGTTYAYAVLARDSAGNVDANPARVGATARNLDRLVARETFEAGDGGFSTIPPNDALSGRWEWGHPQATPVQPGNCYSGQNCWVTGLLALGGA